MELEGLGSFMRHWMKVPYLEFKQGPNQPSRAPQTWVWNIQQWWHKRWGIDYETQVETVKEKHTECDDRVDDIKVIYVYCNMFFHQQELEQNYIMKLYVLY